jgi:hypothetical protein
VGGMPNSLSWLDHCAFPRLMCVLMNEAWKLSNVERRGSIDAIGSRSGAPCAHLWFIAHPCTATPNCELSQNYRHTTLTSLQSISAAVTESHTQEPGLDGPSIPRTSKVTRARALRYRHHGAFQIDAHYDPAGYRLGFLPAGAYCGICGAFAGSGRRLVPHGMTTWLRV